MKILKIDFDFTTIEDCCKNINSKEIRDLLINYNIAKENIVSTLAIPLLFMTHGIGFSKKRYNLIPEEIRKIMIEGELKVEAKEMAKVLVNKYEEYNKKANEELLESATSEVESIITKIPEIQMAYTNLGLNAIVNCWTIFEAYSKDLWIYCLNNFPKLFINNILKEIGIKEIEGINNKSINIGLLAKYNFNISENLGDLMALKYDFTCIDGIKKAYKELFNLDKCQLEIFIDQNLNQFEITRNVFVHNAGVIDERYLKRSNKSHSEKIKDRIVVNEQEAGLLINSGTNLLVKLIQIADIKISKN